MDYQPIDQAESKSGLGIAIVVLVLAGLAGWYFYSMSATTSTLEPIPGDQPFPQVSGDSDVDVADDLEQIPDDSALDQDAAALDKDISGL
ncbi:MAG: hypothetical protein Q7S19_03800 [bacterium]|nr:hypothetical protein [bacterium]